MAIASNIKIPVKCPKCGKTTQKTLAEMERQHTFTCACGQSFKVDPRGFKAVGDALADFQKSITKLFK